MGLGKWIVSKGHVGSVSRDIGDLYASIRRNYVTGQEPRFLTEFCKAVEIRYGCVSEFDILAHGVRTAICRIIARKSGLDPREGNEKFCRFAEEIMIEELRSRGVPDNFIR